MSNQIKQNKETFFIILLLVSDVLSVFIAFLSGYYLRNKGFFRYFLESVQSLETYFFAFLFATILLIILFSINGLYQLHKRRTAISEMYIILRTVTFWILLFMAGAYISKYDYSRIIVLLIFFFTLFYIIIFRFILKSIKHTLFTGKIFTTNVAIIGTGKLAKEIEKELLSQDSSGIRLIGFIKTDTKQDDKKKHIGSINSLNSLIKKYSLSEIFVAEPNLSNDRILTIIAKCKKTTVKFKIVSNIFTLLTGTITVSNLESIPTLEVGKVTFPLWKNIYKYFFDFCIALFFLFVTFPLFILISIAIKLDSKGNIFITQKRIGLYGKPFCMYKFRTMSEKTPLYNTAPKKRNDARITNVGFFLRKHSLDELPQLINVIKGDMSLVGPRPEMQFIVKKYSSWEKRRLSVKPGLTGLWQILGRKDLPLTDNLEYDFYYISNQSFFLDIAILIKTIPVVIKGKGAY